MSPSLLTVNGADPYRLALKPCLEQMGAATHMKVGGFPLRAHLR